jgi:cysteine desulfurase
VYAIIATVDIAMNETEQLSVRTSDISKRQNISEKFLESILPVLKRQGLLSSTLGPGGGYKLAKKSGNISLMKIVEAMNHSLQMTRCNGYGHNGCLETGKRCKTHDLWHTLEKKLTSFFEDVTIHDIINDNISREKIVEEIKQNKQTDGLIYLDNNATIKPINYAKERIIATLDKAYNPSSIHYQGQIARRIIEESRENIKNHLSVSNNYNLLFTSSGTEANNLVFHSFGNFHHVISKIEHSSVLKSAKHPILIDVNKDGIIELEKLEEILSQLNGRKLVSVIFANNEIGVIQPINEIVKICRKYNALIHTDAVQVLGKLKFNLSDYDVDLVTISSHKIGGGFGAAGLIYKKDLKLKPMIVGGAQEGGLRAGTENISAISGFSGAVSFLDQSISRAEYLRKLRNYLENELIKKISSTIIAGKNADRLPNTSCIILPGVENTTQLMHFDLNNICVSSGSACSSGQVEPSHVLLAMGFSHDQAKSSIRISLSAENTMEDINNLVSTWEILYNNICLDLK